MGACEIGEPGPKGPSVGNNSACPFYLKALTYPPWHPVYSASDAPTGKGHGVAGPAGAGEQQKVGLNCCCLK